MTGWTWDQVRDGLDLVRVEALQKQWRTNPPLTITMRLTAEAMGVEFKDGGSSSSEEKAEFDPMAIMNELGLVEGPAYVRPNLGMPI